MSAQGRKFGFGVAMAALLIMAAGCGRESALTPEANSLTGQAIVLPASERPWATGSLQSSELPGVTVLVSAERGGVVQMGRYRLEFPAGALAQDTAITIQQADPLTMTVHLLPHGLQFLRPVTFTSQVGDLLSPSSHRVGISWRNDDDGTWDVVGVDGAESGFGRASLRHFSDYNVWEE